MISVVVRARNERRWIGRCLWALKQQRLGDIDVVVVDNDSSDGTVDVARDAGCTVRHISAADFTFGRALNLGVEACRHAVVAVLSAHCIPADELWADHVAAHLAPRPAGSTRRSAPAAIYGRQEPLPDTAPADRRDLWTTFRGERVVQRQDGYFHNANSAFRREIWLEHPFDEELAGVEDQDWGHRITAAGHVIVYEPGMRAYHHHGIHHGGDAVRAERVSRALSEIRQRPSGDDPDASAGVGPLRQRA